MEDRLSDSAWQRLQFVLTADRLKTLERENRLHDISRRENVAEHSWHAMLLAMVFSDAAPEGTDHARVRDLLIVHDLVEVYAGDTVLWLDVDAADVEARERAAADQLIQQLPELDQAFIVELTSEFLAQESIEAQFARAVDALHPMVLTWGPGGQGHRRATLTTDRVLDRKRPFIARFPMLWDIAQELVRSAEARGMLLAADAEDL